MPFCLLLHLLHSTSCLLVLGLGLGQPGAFPASLQLRCMSPLFSPTCCWWRGMEGDTEEIHTPGLSSSDWVSQRLRESVVFMGRIGVASYLLPRAQAEKAHHQRALTNPSRLTKKPLISNRGSTGLQKQLQTYQRGFLSNARENTLNMKQTK